MTDDRVAWRMVERDGIRLWWHEGDDAFAERALDDRRGSAGVGVRRCSARSAARRWTSSSTAMRGRSARAMGPGTRENVGGQAHPGDPHPVRAHPAVADRLRLGRGARPPRAHPPRLRRRREQPVRLSAALAQRGRRGHLSRGLDDGDRAQVEAAARGGTIIPLEGLDGQFPTRARRFSLAYAESASAVDVPRRDVWRGALRSLVGGLRRRARHRRRLPPGHSAWTSRRSPTGWLESVGSGPIEPTGPRPAPPGPVPEDWRSSPAPLIR